MYAVCGFIIVVLDGQFGGPRIWLHVRVDRLLGSCSSVCLIRRTLRRETGLGRNRHPLNAQWFAVHCRIPSIQYWLCRSGFKVAYRDVLEQEPPPATFSRCSMVRGALPDTFRSVITSTYPISRSNTGSWGLLGPSTRASTIPKAHNTSIGEAVPSSRVFIYIYTSSEYGKGLERLSSQP